MDDECETDLDSSTLDHIITHIFLTPRLSECSSDSVSCDSALLQCLGGAWEDFRAHMAPDGSGVIDYLQRMIYSLDYIRDPQGSIHKAKLEELLGQLQQTGISSCRINFMRTRLTLLQTSFYPSISKRRTLP